MAENSTCNLPVGEKWHFSYNFCPSIKISTESLNMGVGTGGQKSRGHPWIFMHGTNLVDRGLKGLFFGLFWYFPVFFPLASLWKRLNSAIFRYFFANFRYFFPLTASLEIFLPTLLSLKTL